ncbi:hypothetical protein KUCAC02_027965, partial [Chaenocephalus aceratus]
ASGMCNNIRDSSEKQEWQREGKEQHLVSFSSTLRSFYLGSWYLKTSVSVPPQVSPPPPSPPPASDSTSAGERSPDGCHRWAFPSELPTTAQCVLSR